VDEPPGFLARLFPKLVRTLLPNPGKYEECDAKSKGVLTLDTFDGVRFDFTRPITNPSPVYSQTAPLFTVSHYISMGSTQAPPSYEFGASFQQLPGMLLMSRIGTDGRLIARFFSMPTTSSTVRVNAQLSNEPHSSQVAADGEYRGVDYSLGLKLGNAGVVGASYLQSITPNLALGGELQYIGVRRITIWSAVARYELGRNTFTGNIASMGAMSLSSHHKINEKTGLAAEVVYFNQTGDSLFRTGYEYRLQRATVKGTIESSGRLQATLENRLSPGITFLVSGEIDHKKTDYKFGFGLRIGGD